MAAYVPTLKTQYKEQIVPALMKEFGYTSAKASSSVIIFLKFMVYSPLFSSIIGF